MKKTIILIILSLTLSRVEAQKVRYLDFSSGMQLISERDEGMSPMRFSGAGIYGGLGLQSQKQSKSNYTQFHFSQNSLTNTNNTRVSELSTQINTFTFYHPDGKESSHFHWGWSNRNQFTMRTNPSMANYRERMDYFTSFGPAVRVCYPFSLFNINFEAQAIAHAQVVGFFLRPSLATSSPSGFIEYEDELLKGFFNSIAFFFPGKAWNVGFTPQLSCPIGSVNKLALSYDFDFYRLNSIAPLTRASGIWKVTLSSRLSK
jgi:hypothetical protein